MKANRLPLSRLIVNYKVRLRVHCTVCRLCLYTSYAHENTHPKEIEKRNNNYSFKLNIFKSLIFSPIPKYIHGIRMCCMKLMHNVTFHFVCS